MLSNTKICINNYQANKNFEQPIANNELTEKATYAP